LSPSRTWNKGRQALLHELHGPWPAQLRPFLVRVEEIDQRDIHDEGLNGIERRDQPLRRACACAYADWPAFPERIVSMMSGAKQRQAKDPAHVALRDVLGVADLAAEV
jgi:hypothetical protein